jgi:DNA primase
MIDKSQIEDIKRNINIVDIALERLSLRKSGSNYFTLCPFHQEKTPSFSINEELQIYHCFGCGESGDVISLIEKLDNVDFNEAIEILANKAHIEIKKNKNNLQSSNNDIFKINKYVTEIFEKNLKANKNALQYIHSRKISDKSIQDFSIGFALSDNSLTKNLIYKGIKKEQLIEFGISIVKDSAIKDKFRNRIIFPIKNTRNEVIGFIGRAIDDYIKPKYLNSPETKVFKKSDILYGINLAKKEITKKDFAIITEGNIDVIHSYQAGVENIIGIQGTALSETHLHTIGRYTNKLYFAFDMDSAGYNALKKSVVLAEKNNFAVKVINLTPYKDIDEFITNKGKDKYIETIIKAEEFPTFAINYETQDSDMSLYEEKIKLIESILPIINKIPNQIRKSFYLSELNRITKIPFDSINEYNLAKSNTNISSELAQNNNIIQKEKKIKIPSSEVYFLYLILDSKMLRNIGLKKIHTEYFIGSNTKKIYDYLIETNFEKDIDKIKTIIFKNINKEYIEKEKDFEEKKKDLNTIIKSIKNLYIKNKIQTLKRQIHKENIPKDELLKSIEKLSSEYITD